jgi:uncharacterized protein YjiS (DUF1127 family)
MSILTHDSNRRATGDFLRNAGHAIAVAAGRLWRHLIAVREQQAQRILIASLTDAQLRDLGISREASPKRSVLDPHTV